MNDHLQTTFHMHFREQPLKYGIISSQTSRGILFFIHAGIEINPY